MLTLQSPPLVRFVDCNLRTVGSVNADWFHGHAPGSLVFTGCSGVLGGKTVACFLPGRDCVRVGDLSVKIRNADYFRLKFCGWIPAE